MDAGGPGGLGEARLVSLAASWLGLGSDEGSDDRHAGTPGFWNATARFGEWAEGDTAGNLSARDWKSANHLIGSSPDPRGVRAAHGLAGRLDDRELAATLNSGGNDGGFRTEPGEHLVAFRKATKAHHDDGEEAEQADTLAPHGAATATAVLGSDGESDPLLPLGLDSHRYRCCGNGVVSTKPEWFGERLARLLA